MSQFAQSKLGLIMEQRSVLPPVHYFFDIIPAEIRIEVYTNILHTDSTLPGQSMLKDYRGFILFCKEIRMEFEYEWTKVFNRNIGALLSNLPLPTTLRASPVSSFGDLKDIRISLFEDAHTITDNIIEPAVERMLKTLLENLNFFSFHPATQSNTLNNRKSIHSWYLTLRYVVEGFMKLEMGNFEGRCEDFDDSEAGVDPDVLPSISVRRRGARLFMLMPHVRVVESFGRM